MRYIVCGADGQLAGRVAEYAIENAPADAEFTFTVYKLARVAPEKIERWNSVGARIVEADYDDIPSLEEAFKDGDRIYIVSGLAIGHRVEQHKNAIDAAIKCGVKHITYSSFIGATDPAYKDVYVTPDHTATEEYLKSTGIPYNACRNNLYMENWLTLWPMLARMSGNVFHSSAGEGKATFIHKDDAAKAAAACLLGKGEDFKAYNICGPEAISVRELCDMVNKESGLGLTYSDDDEDAFFAWTDSLGIPKVIEGDFSKAPIPFCAMDGFTNEQAVKTGLMNVPSNDVELLTGDKPKSAQDVAPLYAAMWQADINNWLKIK